MTTRFAKYAHTARDQTNAGFVTLLKLTLSVTTVWNCCTHFLHNHVIALSKGVCQICALTNVIKSKSIKRGFFGSRSLKSYSNRRKSELHFVLKFARCDFSDWHSILCKVQACGDFVVGSYNAFMHVVWMTQKRNMWACWTSDVIDPQLQLMIGLSVDFTFSTCKSVRATQTDSCFEFLLVALPLFL